MSRNTESERPAGQTPRGSRFAGLLRLAEVLRSLPERLKRPETALLLLAIFASVGAHMPPYVGLGALASYFAAHPPPVAIPPSEVSFEVADPSNSQPEAAPEPPPPVERERPKPEKKKPALAKAEPKKEPELTPAPPKPKLPEPPKPSVSQVTVEPPKSDPRKQSITQKSADPDVEPPPNAQFLAEQSQRVEEETVAKVTDPTRDDPEPNAAAPQAEGDEAAGDSSENQRPVQAASQDANKTQKAEATTAEPAPAQPTPPAPQRPSEARKAEAAQPQQPIIIHDPMGSFALVPAQPSRAAQAAREGRAGSASPSPQQPSLKVSWRAFEETFGAEQLAQDRMPKEAKRRGAGREKRWGEFRAAVENYVAGVKPGNTTALNAAADPFAAYLAAFHRNLHMEFAHEFLGNLPMVGELGNPNLVTKVEIVVNPDGTLDRVGVVGSSGNMMYDFGAFNAVQRGAPYPPTSEKIRSPDGRTYLRWALHRNESQCGTWNAEPYILRTPPRSPNDPPEDNVSPYRTAPGDRQGGAPTPTNGPGKAVVPGETLGARVRRGVRVAPV